MKKGIQNKGEQADVDKVLALDSQRRDILQKVERLKHERNVASKEVSQLKKAGQDASEIIEKTRSIGQEIKQLDDTLSSVEEELSYHLDRIPNIPHESVPIGKDPEDNVVVSAWGKTPEFDFKVSDHLEIGERLDILDFPRGSKISGRGFPVYKGLGAKLERALINFMLDLHTEQHGYREIFPPFVVNRESMRGTGQLPKLEDDMYFCDRDDLFLIPTAEVPLTNLHRDEVFDGETLPHKYCAYSACFRREAGSWGKETRGFLRVHQFNKVELVKYTTPEASYNELELLLKEACRTLELLNVPYRVIELCSGDLSFAAAKCYDLEVWSPAEQSWLEVSSCSNFEDFQARRMNIRYRKTPNAKPEFLHTLNGSGLATSRLMVALLEINQTEDGSVIVPEVLRKYTGFNSIKREY
ncbi:serine--tRNA ligase [Candidatus Saccharibacteria bacterium]|nr:serine--tRNA ligase [Calditrichia bacterium]NIV72705.1 serine--tRNA ligase [Calditrichia bacterium]NIV99852.1 serine--tRNA ligase [Candidatus Saccharibacteria bacterium]NIW80776.1 serine--tRNA ligase [Calditrichia bacterium]